jgi:hypothetical integral membrane protein (TIGR02206 family)
VTDAEAASSLARFEPFSPLHALAVAICIAGWALLVARFREVRGTGCEGAARLALAGAIVAFNLGWTVYRLTPAYYDVDASLPLHACDFAWMLGALAVARRERGPASGLVRQAAFFYGLGLAPLGVVTPVLEDGPTDIDFWAFWLRHFLIPAAALVDLLAFSLVPTRRGLLATIAFTTILLVPITALNLELGTSYFFTGTSLPSNPTPLDYLGPWPLRLGSLALLGAAWLSLLLLLGSAVSRRASRT